MTEENTFEQCFSAGERALKELNLDAAWQQFGEALACEPQSPRALNKLGVVLCHRQQFGEACDYFRKAIEMDPVMVAAYNNLGNATMEMGDLETARTYYEKALAIDPDHPLAHHNLGIVYRRQGKLHLAVPELKRGRRLLSRQEKRRMTDREKMIGMVGVGVIIALLLAYMLLAK